MHMMKSGAGFRSLKEPGCVLTYLSNTILSLLLICRMSRIRRPLQLSVLEYSSVCSHDISSYAHCMPVRPHDGTGWTDKTDRTDGTDDADGRGQDGTR